MADEINGWKPPLIYDLGRDERRIATQEDVDRLMHVTRILAAFKADVEEALRKTNSALGADRSEIDG